MYRVIVLYNEARAVRALSFGLLRWLSRQRLNCWEIDNRVGYATETANLMICEWFAGPHGDDTILYLAYIFFAQGYINQNSLQCFITFPVSDPSRVVCNSTLRMWPQVGTSRYKNNFQKDYVDFLPQGLTLKIEITNFWPPSTKLSLKEAQSSLSLFILTHKCIERHLSHYEIPQ